MNGNFVVQVTCRYVKQNGVKHPALPIRIGALYGERWESVRPTDERPYTFATKELAEQFVKRHCCFVDKVRIMRNVFGTLVEVKHV